MKIEQRKMLRQTYDATNSIAFPTILELIFADLINKRDAKGLSEFISWLRIENRTKAMHKINYLEYYNNKKRRKQ